VWLGQSFFWMRIIFPSFGEEESPTKKIDLEAFGSSNVVLQLERF
jgi:hypothetical protein